MRYSFAKVKTQWGKKCLLTTNCCLQETIVSTYLFVTSTTVFSRSGSRITFFVVVFVFIEVKTSPPQVNATSTAAPASTSDFFYTSVQSVLMVQLPIRQPEVIVSTIAVVGKWCDEVLVEVSNVFFSTLKNVVFANDWFYDK